MKAKKFEQQFDEGVDLTVSLDLSKARRVLQAQKRVLDREAIKLRCSGLQAWQDAGACQCPLAVRHEARSSLQLTTSENTFGYGVLS